MTGPGDPPAETHPGRTPETPQAVFDPVALAGAKLIEACISLGSKEFEKLLKARLIDIQVLRAETGPVSASLHHEMRWQLKLTNNGGSAVALTKLTVPRSARDVAVEWPSRRSPGYGMNMGTPERPGSADDSKLHLVAPESSETFWLKASVSDKAASIEIEFAFRWLRGSAVHSIRLDLQRVDDLAMRIEPRR